MKPEELQDKLDDLTSLVKIQTDLIGALQLQAITTTGRLEAIISMQRQLLVKSGMDRKHVDETSKSIYAQCLIAAQQESAQALASSLKPPAADGPSGASSGGSHLN